MKILEQIAYPKVNNKSHLGFSIFAVFLIMTDVLFTFNGIDLENFKLFTLEIYIGPFMLNKIIKP